MLRLALKAFYPGKIPFPLLHIDTTYKFPEMISFRDSICKELGLKLIVGTNQEALKSGASPFRLGTSRCCQLLKTQALLEALAHYDSDAAIGGARRDEEKSRAKRGCSPIETTTGSGILRTSGRNCGIFIMLA